MQEKTEKPHLHTEKAAKLEVNVWKYRCSFWCTSIRDGDVLEKSTLKEPLIKSHEKK